MSKEAEDFIEHFGVKGMKWGVRKRASTLVSKAKGGPKEPASEDAVKAKALKKTAKTSSTDALSNKQLQDLVTRMNLEQQYSRLSMGDRSPAQKFVADTLLNVGKQQITRLANDTAATQVGNLLKDKKK